MKNTLTILGITLIATLAIGNVSAQKLGNFGSLTTKKVGPKTVAVPYSDVVTYLGFAAPNTEDEVRDGKKFYYLYLWVPAVAPEIGVRMMSPAGSTKVKNAITAKEYTENKDSKEYFDTYITIEKSNILTKDKISAEGVKDAKWTILSRNDDSSEMPKNPAGRKYNSLLRYKSDASNPLKALTAGLYRIGFTTFKKGEVNGTFIAQVASPVALPGVGVAKTIDELLAQINK